MTQAKPSQRNSFSSVGIAISKLWCWWSSELKDMQPTSMARWFDGDAITTNVAVDDGSLTILPLGAGVGKASPPQRVPLDALTSSPVLRAMIAAGRDRVRLVLSPEQALVKTVTLPLATEENLRAVVGFELDRHTPFTPDQASYDVQIVRRDPQQEKIMVSLAVAAKSEITALVDTLSRAGLTCTAIGISQGVADNAASFDLQAVVDKPPRRLSRIHVVNLGMLGFAALLAFAAVILPIWQKREVVRALIPQTQKSGAEFLLSERVYTEYTQLVAEYNFLATRKHAVYPVVSVLEELARTFPDTTWVQMLNIKTNAKLREVTMQGETQSASKVIENLEQSPTSLFQNSKQLTQTIRVQTNIERFNISAEIKPRTVPPAESIDDVAAPVIAAPIAQPISAALPATATVTPVPSANAAATVAPPGQPAPSVAPEPAIVKGSLVAPALPTTPPDTRPAPTSTPAGKRSGT